MSDWSEEETNEPLLAHHRNFYKVEKWTKNGRVERMRTAAISIRRGRFSPPQSSIARVQG
jgi:hypothetical protein